jgi:hypothetical protein
MEMHSKQGIFKDVVNSIRAIFRDKWYHIKTRVTFSGEETRLNEHGIARHRMLDKCGGVKIILLSFIPFMRLLWNF